MATARQKNLIGQIVPVLDSIVNFEPPDLIQRERLGSELSFDFLLPLLTEICSSVKRLREVDLEKVPFGTLNQIFGPLQQIRGILGQIKAFSPASHGNALQVRDTYAASLEDHWNNLYLPMKAILAVPEEESRKKELEGLSSQIQTSVQLSSDAADNLRTKQFEIENSLDVFLKEKSAEFEREGEAKLELINKALDDVRNAAAEAGVSQNAVYFKDEAEEHLRDSRFWRNSLVFVTVILLLFSMFGTEIFNFLGSPEPGPTAGTVVQIKYLSQKALVVFCLFFGLIWSARNYGASRHNYVVNKHRNNALGSFQAFVSSARDDQTRNAVLIQATQSIFSPQPSGYVKSDGENSPSSPIVEIIRAVSSGGKAAN